MNTADITYLLVGCALIGMLLILLNADGVLPVHPFIAASAAGFAWGWFLRATAGRDK